VVWCGCDFACTEVDFMSTAFTPSPLTQDLVEKRQTMIRDFTEFRRKKAEEQKLRRKLFLEGKSTSVIRENTVLD